MNKELILTVVCCALFVLAFGRSNISSCRVYSEHVILCMFPETPGNLFIDSIPDRYTHYFVNDSTIAEIKFSNGPCKNEHVHVHITRFKPHEVVQVPIPIPIVIKDDEEPRKKTHGDLRYEYSTHNSPDTTYPGSGFNQNYVIGNLYTTIADKYPVVFHFGTLQTTVPYIPNNIDVSLQFDQQQYSSDLASQLRHKYQDKVRQAELEDSASYRSVLNNFNHTESIQNWLGGDKQVQELMQSASILHQFNVTNKLDSAALSSLGKLSEIENGVNIPSVKNGLSAQNASVPDTSKYSSGELKKAMQFIDRYKRKLDSLEQLKSNKDSLVNRYDSLNTKLKNGKDSLNRVVSGDLKTATETYSDSGKGKSQRWLLGVRKFGIGRNFIDYSQLSAKNISLFGLNTEYCDRFYYALAVGKTDFRYQDFLTSTPIPKQYLLLGRFGVGEREAKHLYFTAYTGSRQSSYYVNNLPTTSKLSGITVEARIPITENIYLTGEVAKSTAPTYSMSTAKPANILSFDSRDNEAYSLQANACFPKIGSRVTAVYNRYGIYFQSFNTYSNNSNQSSWLIRWDQNLWKNKLMLSASMRRNDYSNPFIINNYNTKTVTYSFQSTLRIKKWPTLSLGYLPFSQVTIMQGQLTENRFYTIYGTTNYMFKVGKTYLNSSLVYTQYFNNSNQTGFIYYDARSWFFNQSVLFGRLTLNGMATWSISPTYHMFSTGPSFQWNVFNSLSVGGAVKYNYLNNIQVNCGYNGLVEYNIIKLGKIGFSYDKGFIPGQNNQFFRNNWGRATYSKAF